MRFTIRDLLWLTVVAALGVGWWIEHRHHSALQAEQRMLTWSHDMLAESLEQALDHRLQRALDSGQQGLFVPIYTDDADSSGHKEP